MSCEHTRAVLQGQAPWVDPSAHLAHCPGCRALAAELDAIDAMALDLPLPQPPAALIQSTLEAMRAELRPRRPHRLWWGAGVALAAAALLFAVLPTAPLHGDPARMVERGVGERLPEVSLDLAVDQQGTLSRYSVDRAYHAGDTVYFRAQVDAPAWVALVRVDHDNARVLHTQAMQPGQADLTMERDPLGWQIEPGEGDAVFAIIGAPQPIAQARVEAALRGAYDPVTACRAAAPLGARCSAVSLHVAPRQAAP